MNDVRYTPPLPRRPGDDQESSLEAVRRSIYTLYRRLSPATIAGFSTSLRPSDISVSDTEDLLLSTQRVAHTLVEHLQLPDTRINVAFVPMPAGRAGRVTLGTGPHRHGRRVSRRGLAAGQRPPQPLLLHAAAGIPRLAGVRLRPRQAGHLLFGRPAAVADSWGG